MNTDTLIGRTDDGRYWWFTRQYRVLVRPQHIALGMVRARILGMRRLDTIGCVKFFEVIA